MDIFLGGFRKVLINFFFTIYTYEGLWLILFRDFIDTQDEFSFNKILMDI